MRQRTRNNKIDVHGHWENLIDYETNFVDLPEYDLPDLLLEESGSGDLELALPTNSVGDDEKINKTKVAEIPNLTDVS